MGELSGVWGYKRVIGHYVLLVGWLFSTDGAVTARNERRDPSGFRLRRIRGGMGSVGTPVSRQALFCFCERILRTRAPLMRTLTREVVAHAR